MFRFAGVVIALLIFSAAGAYAGTPPPGGPGEFAVATTLDFPTSGVQAQSVTPCPPLPGAIPLTTRYIAETTNAPDVELPYSGGPWSTPVDFRSFGKETFEVSARCITYGGITKQYPGTVTLVYKPVTVTVALGPTPAPPAPSVPARPRFTG